MHPIDPQAITFLEAVVLLVSNGVGAALAGLAWRVSDVDVREAGRWEPAHADPAERARLKHNRCIITEDARYGEARRFWAHVLIGVVGLFWLFTPQPVNPQVIWWAVAIRAVVFALSLLLIDKTLHHLVARWRFDRPADSPHGPGAVRPALRLAWRDMRMDGPTPTRQRRHDDTPDGPTPIRSERG